MPTDPTATPIPKRKHKQPKSKRKGAPTKAEKALVAQLVLDQPAEMSVSQVNALARTLRRSKDVVREMVERARENFVASAEDYVEVHRRATAGALESRDFEVAGKLSQWAMSNISEQGVCVIEKAAEGPSGPRILVGIRIGGIDQPAVTVKSE